MADADGLTIKFRCRPELEGVLPQPIPAGAPCRMVQGNAADRLPALRKKTR
jgi:hypothetical protein